MSIEKAKLSDGPELSRFFSSLTLQGEIDLRVHRPRDFFDQYRLQSDKFETHVLRDSKNEIEGLGTVIYRNALVNGEEVPIGYCTDLRIATTREAIIGWTKHFLPTLERSKEEYQCKYFFSVIVPQENRAYNALVRPRSSRRNIPRFYMLSRFQMVNILGRAPWASLPLKTIDITRAQESDLEALADYLKRNARDRYLSFVYSPELLKKRLETWPGLTIESFLIAKDRKKNIIGCVAPWDSYEVQYFTVEKYHGFLRSLKRALDVTSLFGLSQSLPSPGKALNFSYLTHLYADNPDIFYSLLFEAYEQTTPTKFLVYTHFPSNLTTIPPKSFFSSSFPLAVYSLLPPNELLPEHLRMIRLQSPPELEMALI